MEIEEGVIRRGRRLRRITVSENLIILLGQWRTSSDGANHRSQTFFGTKSACSSPPPPPPPLEAGPLMLNGPIKKIGAIFIGSGDCRQAS